MHNEPQFLLRLINFNIGKDDATLLKHNPPNKTVSSKIKINLQLYVSMNIYFLLSTKPDLKKGWTSVPADRERRNVSLHLSEALLDYSMPLRAPFIARCWSPPLSPFL